MEIGMNKINYIIITGIALLLMGCPARSIFPLFTQDDLVYKPELVGTWTNENDNDLTFQKVGEMNYYKVNALGKNGNSEAYSVRLGQVGKYWFIDSYPTKSGGDHHFIASHIISKIELKGDTMRLSSLEEDWLKEMIDEKKLTIAHVQRGSDLFLTATTEELQSLILKCAGDEKAFPQPDVFVRAK